MAKTKTPSKAKAVEEIKVPPFVGKAQEPEEPPAAPEEPKAQAPQPPARRPDHVALSSVKVGNVWYGPGRVIADLPEGEAAALVKAGSVRRA